MYLQTVLGRIEFTTCIMRPIATDEPIAQCVCQSFTCLRCTKMVKRIEVLFAIATLGDAWYIIYGNPEPSYGKREEE